MEGDSFLFLVLPVKETMTNTRKVVNYNQNLLSWIPFGNFAGLTDTGGQAKELVLEGKVKGKRRSMYHARQKSVREIR